MKKKSNWGGKVTQDAHRQQKSGNAYGYLNLTRDVNMFSPEPGSRVKLDFLPYEVTDPKHPDLNPDAEIAVKGSLWYKRPFSTHRNIGVKNESVICLASVGKKCPICEYRQKRIKAGADSEETDALKPSRRNLYVVVPLDSKKHEVKPHVFDISQYLFQELLNEELAEDDENGIFPSLEEGLTLKIRFDSKTIGNSQPFAEASRIDFIERDDQYEEKILDEVPNLDEILNVLSYEELQAKLLEVDNEETGGKLKDEEEEEDDDKPTRSSSRTRGTRDKEEEEDDDKPVRRTITSTQRSSRKDEETEENEEKPSRTRSSSKREEPKEDECPSGHVFGRDFEKEKYKKDCETCEKWDDCYDANKQR